MFYSNNCPPLDNDLSALILCAILSRNVTCDKCTLRASCRQSNLFFHINFSLLVVTFLSVDNFANSLDPDQDQLKQFCVLFKQLFSLLIMPAKCSNLMCYFIEKFIM